MMFFTTMQTTRAKMKCAVSSDGKHRSNRRKKAIATDAPKMAVCTKKNRRRLIEPTRRAIFLGVTRCPFGSCIPDSSLVSFRGPMSLPIHCCFAKFVFSIGQCAEKLTARRLDSAVAYLAHLHNGRSGLQR